MAATDNVAVLGASGLIGEAIVDRLLDLGIPVVAVARRFTAAQKVRFAESAVQTPLVSLDSAAIAALFGERGISVVVNCVGVLQDGPKGRTKAVHTDFVRRLIASMARRDVLLIQISVPEGGSDPTDFSRSKRAADAAIQASGLQHVILRPGFVVAPRAYGGSALMRALAALPFDLPRALAARPFAVTAMADITGTVTHVIARWFAGARNWHAVWDIVGTATPNVGEVLKAFRAHFGGPQRRVSVPGFVLQFGALCGDLVSLLGWSPPIRSTALAEMRRGIHGEPGALMAETGFAPAGLEQAVRALPATVQESWFGRLYLLKAIAIVVLGLFWSLSGLLALTVAFAPAVGMLTEHGISIRLAETITWLTGFLDLAIGVAIAFASTCRAGLRFGIGLTICYLAAATLLVPELWLAPLGPLVKALPAVVLMMMLDAILDDR